MRTDQMVHEIDRLEGLVKELTKAKAQYRELWVKSERDARQLRHAMDEILQLPPESNDHYIIAGNALGQARDRYPAEGKIPRVISQREYDLRQFERGVTADWNAGRPKDHDSGQVKTADGKVRDEAAEEAAVAQASAERREG